jgi:hypothetical protein
MEHHVRLRSVLARIAQWSTSAEVFLTYQQWAGPSANDAIGLLIDQASALYTEVTNLWQSAESPTTLRESLAPIIKEKGFRLTSRPHGLPGLLGFHVALAAVRAPIGEELMRNDGPRRALVDRAFLHLNRTLVVDHDVQARWSTALAAGETECERWGALHLLQHGIYAFKAHAIHARTDLILGTPLQVDERVRSAEALVLTEWKVADATNAPARAAEAKRQIAAYAAGALGGFELRSVRYVVVVSDRSAPMPADEREGEVTYRYVNIAVRPHVPSVGARIGGPR